MCDHTLGHAAHRRCAVLRISVDGELGSFHELFHEHEPRARSVTSALVGGLELPGGFYLRNTALAPAARRLDDDRQPLCCDECFDVGEGARAREARYGCVTRTVRFAHQILRLAAVDGGDIAVEGHAHRLGSPRRAGQRKLGPARGHAQSPRTSSDADDGFDVVGRRLVKLLAHPSADRRRIRVDADHVKA